jgi:arginine:pyruvate transaminase
MPKLSTRIERIIPEGKDGWEVHVHALNRQEAGDDIFMLSVGDHEFPTPAPTVRACIRALEEGHHHYTNLAGLPRLRRAIRDIASRSTGVNVQEDEIIATTGGQAALFGAMLATLDPGDHGIIISPYYATYPATMNCTGASHTVVLARAENGFQPDADDIRAAIRPETRVLLINSPNNPTGAVYTVPVLQAIAGICIEHDLWLISDEVYWTHTGPLHPHVSPIVLSGMRERTLIVNSMSKSHGMTGWRIGWLQAPPHVIRRLVDLNLASAYGLNDFVSRAAAEALEQDYGVAEIAARYESRRRAFVDAVKTIPGIVVRGSEGGMYVMIDIREVAASGEEFAWALLEEENIAVLPGESFGPGAAGHVRISMCESEQRLSEAASRLERFLLRCIHGAKRAGISR